MKIKNATWAVGRIKPDPKNPRRHPAKQVATLAESIRRFGLPAPIVVRPTGSILDGHGRLEAAVLAGVPEVEVRIVEGLTDAQYKALALTLNRIPQDTKWDDGLLGDALRDLLGEGEDLAGLGFSEKEIADLTAEDEGVEVRTLEIDTVADEFWISVRGPLIHQADMLQALTAAAEKLPGVDVEIGTIAIE